MKALLCTLFLSTLGIAAAKADTISITFDKPAQIGTSGSFLAYYGTITNLSNATVYLNSSALNLLGSNLTTTDQFFNTVPISLAAGANSGDIQLFDVSVASAPTVTEAGSYGLEGGADSNASDNLGSSTFSVTAPAASAPEIDPSLASSGLVLIAGAIVVLRGRRFRQAA